MTDPDMMKTKSYTMIEACHIRVAQARQQGCFYDLPAESYADRVVHNSVKVGPYGQTGYFVAVLDGHGPNGAAVSTFAAATVPDLVKKELLSITRVNHRSIEEAVIRALSQLSNAVEKQTEFPFHLSGATICASLIMNSIVYTWQIGDALAWQYDESDDGLKLKPQQLCLRHNLLNMGERNRIFGKGGRIGRLEFESENGDEDYGSEKVFLPGTDFSSIKTRTLGDRLFHKHCNVIDKPDFAKYKLCFGTRYLVFTTDANLNENSLTELLQENKMKSVEELCTKVINLCVEDNIKLRNFNSDKPISKFAGIYESKTEKDFIIDANGQITGMKKEASIRYEGDKIILNYDGKEIASKNIDLENGSITWEDDDTYKRKSNAGSDVNINLRDDISVVIVQLGEDNATGPAPPMT